MKNRKHILLALALVAALTTTEGAVINSMAAETDIIVEAEATGLNDGDAVINSSHIYWVYKYIGSFLYKRLYNATTGEYIGDWIPAN